MAGPRTGYKSAVRKPVGRRVRVWRCCGRPLGDSRSRREAHSDSGAGKGLGHRVRRRQVPQCVGLAVHRHEKHVAALEHDVNLPQIATVQSHVSGRPFDPILKRVSALKGFRRSLGVKQPAPRFLENVMCFGDSVQELIG
jgi:hypothetical protein